MRAAEVGSAMGRGRAIGMMAGAIVALSAISLFVLFDTPADSDDSTEQMMIYLSLLLFVMALALVGPLAFVIARRGARHATEDSPPDPSEEEGGDESSDIELEFRALEMELDLEERR